MLWHEYGRVIWPLLVQYIVKVRNAQMFAAKNCSILILISIYCEHTDYLFQNIPQKLMIFVDLSTWHHKYSSFTAAIAYMYTCELILHELTHLYRSQHLFPFRFTFKFYNVECMLHSLFSFHRISIESANKDKNGRDLFANNKHIAYSQR